MKNLTEFSGVILRQAASVRSTKLAELKASAKAAPASAVAEAETGPVLADDPNGSIVENQAALAEAAAPAQEAVPAEEAPVEAAPAAEAEAAPAEEAPVEAAPAAEAEAAPAEEAPAQEAAVPAEEANAKKPVEPRIDDETLAAAVGKEMGIEGDKLSYLMGALKAVGRKGLAQVRKVRVFQGEEGPAGAFSIGELHFVVDRIVVASKARDEGKGRGGRGKGGKGGKGRGRSENRGGGGGGAARPSGHKGGTGFDSMRKDERIGDVPTGGLGWSLSKTPGSEKNEGRGRGKPRRKGPRRGKPGAKPGEDRKPSNRNRNRNRKPRTDNAGAKAPEVTVKAPMVPAGKPTKAPAPVNEKPTEAQKSEA